ncbi:PIN domain-containing protein [Legionella rowbothamii]|uniref:PIN domain-containing protein n=1 Tax=Legionella rowbothamii TaxID=96229 RepID=UPI00105671C5|nr:PIN domain-containing protein [Legionella rowbothamii]
MGHFTVLYDANVLYPAPLRDVLMQLASTGLYRAKWTNRIHEEWIRNVLKNRPDLSRELLDKTKNIMNSAVLDCLVEHYEDIEVGLKLPDLNDRHVLAAAIVSGCDVIVTFNTKDFPNKELEKYSIESQHPDDFLMHLTDLDCTEFCSAIKEIRMRLKNPPKNITEYLEILSNQGLSKTVSFLDNHSSLL